MTRSRRMDGEDFMLVLFGEEVEVDEEGGVRSERERLM